MSGQNWLPSLTALMGQGGSNLQPVGVNDDPAAVQQACSQHCPVRKATLVQMGSCWLKDKTEKPLSYRWPGSLVGARLLLLSRSWNLYQMQVKGQRGCARGLCVHCVRTSSSYTGASHSPLARLSGPDKQPSSPQPSSSASGAALYLLSILSFVFHLLFYSAEEHYNQGDPCVPLRDQDQFLAHRPGTAPAPWRTGTALSITV